MNILVYKNDSIILNESDKIKKSKYIICPECKELCFIEFKNYQLILKDCKDKHE